MRTRDFAGTTGPYPSKNLLTPEVLDTHFRRQQKPIVLGKDVVRTPMPTWNHVCMDGGGKQGLAMGWHTIVAGTTGAGKALAVDTPVPTPSGWSTMGDLSVGDTVFGMLGQQVAVEAVTDVMEGRPCYELFFDDGTSIVADAGHQWFVWDRGGKGGHKIPTTADMHSKKRTGKRPRFSVPVPGAIETEDAHVCVDPYVLGLWLADGTARAPEITVGPEDMASIFTELYLLGCSLNVRGSRISVDATGGRLGMGMDVARDIRAAVTGGLSQKEVAASLGVSRGTVSLVVNNLVWKEGVRPSLSEALKEMNVYGNKHLPQECTFWSIPQRKALLQGLMDGDGCAARGKCEFTNTNKSLALGVVELLASLGFKSSMSEGRATLYGKDCGPKYRVNFTAYVGDEVFGLARKAARLRIPPHGSHVRRVRHRTVTDIKPVASVPVRCIQVSGHMFLAGKSMIPTHNSILALNCAAQAVIDGVSCGFISLEMSKEQLISRMLGILTGEPVARMQRGPDYDPQFAEHIRERMQERVGDARLMTNDDDLAEEPLHDIKDIIDLCKHWIDEQGCRMIVLDYMQLAGSGTIDQVAERVTEISRAVRGLAHHKKVVTLGLSQFNRSTSSNYTDKPRVQGLFGASGLENDANQVVMLDHSRYEKTSYGNKTYLLIGKNRHGGTPEIPILLNTSTLQMYEAMPDETDSWPA